MTYDNTFGDHTIGVLLATTADHSETRGLEVTGTDLADESAYLQYLAYAKSLKGTDYLTGPDANVSLIGRLAYSYADRYFLTASFRRDYAVCQRRITMVIFLLLLWDGRFRMNRSSRKVT